MQGGHVCKTKQNLKKRKRSSLEGGAKMESQWIVELTSSGRVDAVKKGPFPLIIYFPIRHCPARGKNTFIWGTLFCEPSNQEPVHSSIVSIEERESVANRLAAAVTACVCVWGKKKIYYFHIVGLRSKRLYKSFVLFYPLIVQLHPYGVSLWLKYGTHDSMSVALYPCLLKYMCGGLTVKCLNVSRQGYQPTSFHVTRAYTFAQSNLKFRMLLMMLR